MSTTKHDGPSEFSQRLINARLIRKMSQAEVAERAGLQPSAVSHFEAGRRAPSFENIRKLADVLMVSADYLLGRVEAMTAVGGGADQLNRGASKLTAAEMDMVNKFIESLNASKKNEDDA